MRVWCKVSLILGCSLIICALSSTAAKAQTQTGSASLPASRKTVRFSASTSWSEPYAFFDAKKNLSGGALKDLMDAMAAKMNRTPQYISLPRKAVDRAAQNLKIDARCYVSPAWVEDPDLYEWTQDVFHVVNMIGFSKKTAPLKKKEDLKGLTVGTVLGYRYPTLDDLFEKKVIFRSDASSGYSNIQKLIQNRLPYAVVEQSEFAWHLKKRGQDLFDIKDFLEIDRRAVQCAVLKASAIPLSDFNQALDGLRHEGFFKTLAEKYQIQE